MRTPRQSSDRYSECRTFRGLEEAERIWPRRLCATDLARRNVGCPLPPARRTRQAQRTGPVSGEAAGARLGTRVREQPRVEFAASRQEVGDRAPARAPREAEDGGGTARLLVSQARHPRRLRHAGIDNGGTAPLQTRASSVRSVRSYSAAARSSERFETFSCSVCASRIEPGPYKRGLPQRGM